MLRSMFSAISGLRSHQTMMDVVGNNIANVNTTGYKNSRATFQESLTQVIRGATDATPAVGGTGPMQIGLGARIAATDTNYTQGATQVTGRPSDLAIQGDGFFRVESDGETFYQRGGAFNWDVAGNLVTPNGAFVLDDAGAPINFDPATVTDPQVGQDGTVTGRDATGAAVAIGTIGLSRFANSNGLERVGSGLFRETANSGAPIDGTPNTNGLGFLQSGTLEMSNVDLAAEFTNMIIAQRGFQANSRTITSSDEILQELVNLKR